MERYEVEENGKKGSLPDRNSNVAPITQLHPFLEGCKDRPDDKEEEIANLRAWVKQQPHLPPLSDDHLLLFLHSNYFNQEATQDSIEAYYSIRTTSPELFANKSLNNKGLIAIWNATNMIAMPQTTPEGYSVLIYRLVDYDPAKLTFNEALKAFFLFNDIRLSEDGLSPGYHVVLDMKGVTLSHLAKVNLSSIRKFMNYIQEGHPARLKGVHVVNSVSFMDRVLALVRPLMKSSLMNLLAIHGSDLSNLFTKIPQEIFPAEYGGSAGPSQKHYDAHRKMIEAKYEKWMEEEELYLMDMSKRPKQAKKPCFITSSLRSLSID